MPRLVTCNHCGWVHFEVSREYIDAWKKKWNEYWPTLDNEGREMFGLPDGSPGPEQYYFRCRNNYKEFHDFIDTDNSMDGHTIQPILGRNYGKETFNT